MNFEGQLAIVATMQAKEGQEETLLRALKQIAASTVKEPGCKMFEVHLDRESPGTFVVIERWTDDAALESHFTTPHMKTFKESAGGALAGPSTIKKLTPVGK